MEKNFFIDFNMQSIYHNDSEYDVTIFSFILFFLFQIALYFFTYYSGTPDVVLTFSIESSGH